MKQVFHALTLLALAGVVAATIIFPAGYAAVAIT